MLAAAARVEGDLRRAKACYRENLALHRELGRMDTVSVELGNLGALAVLEGNLTEAEPLIRESLEIAYKRGDRYVAPYELIWLGRVALGQGNPTRAATLFAAAKAQFDATGLAMDPDEGPEYEKGLAAIRRALDDAPFEAAWAEGKKMNLDDAVTFALGPPHQDASNSGMNSSRSADVVLQGLSVLVEGQIDVRKPEGQPDQSHNQQSDGEQDQSWLQQQHRISDEPKQVSSSLNRPALGRIQRVRKTERVEVEPRIDQRENRHSDDNQGELEKNRVDFTGSKARVEKEQQERENRDARPDERHDTADV